jgi:hypothetical protein
MTLLIRYVANYDILYGRGRPFTGKIVIFCLQHCESSEVNLIGSLDNIMQSVCLASMSDDALIIVNFLEEILYYRNNSYRHMSIFSADDMQNIIGIFRITVHDNDRKVSAILFHSVDSS